MDKRGSGSKLVNFAVAFCGRPLCIHMAILQVERLAATRHTPLRPPIVSLLERNQLSVSVSTKQRCNDPPYCLLVW